MDRNSENNTFSDDSKLDLDISFQPGSANDESGTVMENGSQAGPSEKQTRERVKNPASSKQNSRKRRRTSDEEFITSKRKAVPKQIIRSCNCTSKCTMSYSDAEKAQLISSFNELGDKNVQDAYLFGLIKVCPVMRRRKLESVKRILKTKVVSEISVDGIEDKKFFTYKYFVNIQGKEIRVCKTAFCGLHGVTKARVERLATHKSKYSTPPKDRRGLSEESHVRKMLLNVVNQIVEHIASFPARETQYTQRDSAKKMLHSDLSVAKMYDLYLEKYEPEVHAQRKRGEKVKPIVTYEYYNQVFNTKFNIHFGHSRTYVCKKCGEQKKAVEDEVDENKKEELSS